MGTGMRGSYLGFTFNGIHSSTFGITRTSDGSRFNQNLLPTIQDKTASIPGRPGAVSQSSNYGTKVFNVPIAYDEVTEQQLQEFSVWLGDKKVHELVFDELPYKHWRAKVTGTASMKWIPFAEGEVERIYKGEGTIQFTCYEPFARCPSDWDAYSEYDNKQEWWSASRLEKSKGKNTNDIEIKSGAETGLQYAFLDQNLLSESSINRLYGYLVDEANIVGQIDLYNCGDMDANFKLRITTSETKIPAGGAYLFSKYPDGNASLVGALLWETMPKFPEDVQISINSKMNLIEGESFGIGGIQKKTGNIYDQYVRDGAYFSLPVGDLVLLIIFDEDSKFIERCNIKVEFDHLYF